MTTWPVVNSGRAARYVSGTEFAHGIGRGAGLRVLRAASLSRGGGAAIIKLGRHLSGILQCFSSPSCYKTKISRHRSAR